jgi:hypothetical protein
MANTFKSTISTSVGTSLTTIYTAPASTTTTVIGLSVANTTANGITVSVKLAKSGGGEAFIVKEAPVLGGSSLIAVGGDQKLVVQQGDSIKVQSSAATSADAIISILELT